MSPVNAKWKKLRKIAHICHMLQRWRRRATASSSSSHRTITNGQVPPDVPAGHVAVCVGSSCRRFIVRTAYLNHPIFRKLLVQAEEEYGYTNRGPLALPCDDVVFEEILRVVSRAKSSGQSQRVGLEDFQKCSDLDYFGYSSPLLQGCADKSIC